MHTLKQALRTFSGPGPWTRRGLQMPLLALALSTTLLGAQWSFSQAAGAFDNDIEGGIAGGWETVNAADFVGLVGTEGQGDYDIYSELGIDVAPRVGDQMLRLGSPKTRNETQNRGLNTIRQTFVADSAQLSVALRLFSIDHRGDDRLRIALYDETNQQLIAYDNPLAEFDFRNDSRGGAICRISCDEAIDVGKRQDFIATDWQQPRLPELVPGNRYTLTIELEAGQNESLASWLYVDTALNLPPEAVINYNPGKTGAAVEGDFVVFDCLQSFDPEGGQLRCEWDLPLPGGETRRLVGPTVVYAFPDDGMYTVGLSVTDGEKTATASAQVTVEDQAPLVNALNVEVLPGGSVDLVCRFADPGAGDTHTVWIDDAVAPHEEENKPALSSGIARTRLTAPAAGDLGPLPQTFEKTCTVETATGGTRAGSDTFTVTVIDPQALAERVDGNTGSTQGSLPPAMVLEADRSTLGALGGPENVAVYELRLPGGGPIPRGSEVVVTVHMPVDYDIAILNGSADPTVSAAPWVSAPFVSAPFVSAPFVSVPFVSAPFVSAPFVSAPFVSAPFVSAPFVSAPFVSAPFVSAPFVSAPFVSAPLTTSLWVSPGFSFENFPFSQLAGAPDGSNIGGLDISFNDLGAQNVGGLFDEPVFVKGISAEFGTTTEELLVEVGPGERGLYLAVIPQAGSYSTAPFSIAVEAAVPPPPADLLGPACDGTRLVDAAGGLEVLRAGGSTTLIVTQKQRMMATFGMSDEEWTAFMADLEGFFARPEVDATVISVPSSWYDTADENPCVVEEQNRLAGLIKGAIDDYRTENTRYVQLMGSLDIVPPYYLPDETQTGNEALFAADLLTAPGTPLGVAIGQGYMLTDAYYVDAEPQPFNGRSLYVEDISISRLLETPEEIVARAKRYVAAGGTINLYSVEAATDAGTQSTGYDFFIDGTEEINRILETFGTGNSTQNNDTWDAGTLRCQFFGKGENCTKPVSAVNAVNAHMSYNAGLTAKGFNCQYRPDFPGLPEGLCSEPLDPLGEVFLSTEAGGIYDDGDGDGPAIDINGVTFSIGCHSGLSVPEAWGLDERLGLPLDPARDWVQELGTWVGSWNFAYGDTEVPDRGTEGIIPLVISNFREGMSLGEALVRAKWQYGAGLFEFGVYDEKSVVGLNLFGMPQAVLEGAGTAGSALAATAAAAASTTASEPVTGLNVTTEQRFNDKGTWWTGADGAQGIVGRPLLPVVKPFELQGVGSGPSIHGAALRGGTYETFLGENPVFPAQTHDLVTTINEPQLCVETLSPTLVASVSSFDSPEGLLQSLIVQPGQFRCTNGMQQDDPGYEVRGDFRIWDSMNLTLERPAGTAPDSDRKPPVVTQQDLLGDEASGTIFATVNAEDDNGIREVIALVYSDDDGEPGGTGKATAFTETERTDGAFRFELTEAYGNLVSFQYIDGAGNITAKTLKGDLLKAIDVSVTAEVSVAATGLTQITVTIADFGDLVEPVLTLDYGDGSEPLVLALDDDSLYDEATDSYTLVLERDYSALSALITIRAEVRAVGALGTAEATISTCFDPQGDGSRPADDIVGCGIISVGTQVMVQLVVDGAIAPDVQYRLVLPQTNTQIKFADGAVTGPNKIQPVAYQSGVDQVTFEFDAGKLRWDGVSEFQFKLETQDGIAGGPGQGFVDETDIKVYVP